MYDDMNFVSISLFLCWVDCDGKEMWYKSIVDSYVCRINFLKVWSRRKKKIKQICARGLQTHHTSYSYSSSYYQNSTRQPWYAKSKHTIIKIDGEHGMKCTRKGKQKIDKDGERESETIYKILCVCPFLLIKQVGFVCRVYWFVYVYGILYYLVYAYI